MPEAGVHTFLRSLGKNRSSRSQQIVFDDGEGISARRGGTQARRELQVLDVVALANYFRTSYEATLYHLLNLQILTQGQFEVLIDQAAAANAWRRALFGPPEPEPAPGPDSEEHASDPWVHWSAN